MSLPPDSVGEWHSTMDDSSQHRGQTTNHDMLIRLETIMVEVRADVKDMRKDMERMNHQLRRHDVAIARHEVLWKVVLGIAVAGGGGTGVWQVLKLIGS